MDMSGASPGEAIWVRKAPQPLWTGARQAMGKDCPLVSKGHLPLRTRLIRGRGGGGGGAKAGGRNGELESWRGLSQQRVSLPQLTSPLATPPRGFLVPALFLR